MKKKEVEMAICKIGVVGGGTMGRDIANLVAQCGIPVAIVEANEELAKRTLDAIYYKNDRAVDKGKLMPDKSETVKTLISTSANISDLMDVDLVIEAVPEELELKQKVFFFLDEILPASVIFASNTSSLSISQMASE